MKMRFDETIPLYYQIENILRERIAAGEYISGEMFPTEDQLTSEFNVSRITVRTALAGLARDGLIIRRRGKGTVVAEVPDRPSPTRLSGFIEDILTMVSKTKVKVLDFDFVAPPRILAEALELQPDQRPLRVEKIRYIDDEPFSHVLNYVPPAIGKKIKRKDMERFPLLEILETQFGIEVGSGRQEITAVIADPRLAPLLEVMVGAPLLKIERTVYDINQRPVEYVVVNYRADRYSYSVNLERSTSGPLGAGYWVVKGN